MFEPPTITADGLTARCHLGSRTPADAGERDGVERSAKLLQGLAEYLEACGNATAKALARTFQKRPLSACVAKALALLKRVRC